MRRYATAALAAFAVLAAAAIAAGALNQDEGWCIYAAELAARGRVLWRDYFFTQGPLMPWLYSRFAFAWRWWGLCGARVLTCAFGFAGMLLFAVLASRLARPGRRAAAGVAAFCLLGCNLYHVYFVSIPKTYAAAALFASAGGVFLAFGAERGRRAAAAWLFALSGLSLAFAAGVRVSIGAALPVAAVALFLGRRAFGRGFAWFALGAVAGLAAVYGPYIADPETIDGFCMAQAYHALRGGFSPFLAAGSVSRLVRWYLPVFALAGLAFALPRLRARGPAAAPMPGAGDTAQDAQDAAAARRFVFRTLAACSAVVAVVHLAAPCPYEDYQVPVMGFFAALAAAAFADLAAPSLAPLLAGGLSLAASFGSPLLEKWTTDGQDRFWTIRKKKTELALLRDAAAEIERLDPGGKTLLTQDLYLAIETGRTVPKGLEMGPFSMLDDAEWRRLLLAAECPVAALSGYAFAVEPPRCTERSPERQLEYWRLLRKNYEKAAEFEAFGQNATLLTILKRKPGAGPSAAAAQQLPPDSQRLTEAAR